MTASCRFSLGKSKLSSNACFGENVLCIIDGPERIISTEIRDYYSPTGQYLITFPICNVSSNTVQYAILVDQKDEECENMWQSGWNFHGLRMLCVWYSRRAEYLFLMGKTPKK